MSHVRPVPAARLVGAVAALVGVLLAGCATQPYSQLRSGSSGPVASASVSASPGATASATSSGSASAAQSPLVPPDTGVSGDVSNLKAAKGFDLPRVVGDYRLSSDPQLEGIYQKNGSPTDIYTAQVTAVSVDAGEIARSLFTGGVKEISGSYCGQLASQPAVCIRQLNGGYLQVTGSGTKSTSDVAAFAASLYRAA